MNQLTSACHIAASCWITLFIDMYSDYSPLTRVEFIVILFEINCIQSDCVSMLINNLHNHCSYPLQSQSQSKSHRNCNYVNIGIIWIASSLVVVLYAFTIRIDGKYNILYNFNQCTFKFRTFRASFPSKDMIYNVYCNFIDVANVELLDVVIVSYNFELLNFDANDVYLDNITILPKALGMKTVK